MQVFEEFFKKADFVFPLKLLSQRNPKKCLRVKNYRNTNTYQDESSVYSSCNYGYEIEDDYLFRFVKQLCLLHNKLISKKKDEEKIFLANSAESIKYR